MRDFTPKSTEIVVRLQSYKKSAQLFIFRVLRFLYAYLRIFMRLKFYFLILYFLSIFFVKM